MDTRPKLPLSIVIPTYCEETLLPLLLSSLAKQYFQPQEVIVADAFSKDKTREIAKSFGAKVVDGGRISVGRNAGAAAAQSEYMLFLDADTILEQETVLGDAFIEFVKFNADIASAQFKVPTNGQSFFARSVGSIIFAGSNIVRSVESLIAYPKWEWGAFILVKKSAFSSIGGFDENLSIGEDSELFKKAIDRGYKYRCLRVYLATSTRRYNTPKKIINSVVWLVLEASILGAGIYAGSSIFKTLGKRFYGKLGGGEGKDPTE